MKRAIISATIFSIILAFAGWNTALPTQSAPQKLEITYIANEGVLVTAGSNKILIDALFDKPNPEYTAPPKEMLEGMEAGSAPFDDLALVHFWFPLHPEAKRIILDVLKPDHVGLIHLPKRLESDAPSKIDMVKTRYKDIFLFIEPGEKKTIH